ncbi:MAG TPA: hypothetical protein DD490_00110, partial [Acidobacteria bacterium]|nr:hypothetical protein [Acidobacteriota bacterium]
GPLPLPLVDLTGLPRELRESTMRALLDAAARRPFCLEHGPLARVMLVRLGDQEHVCQVAAHHIVSDQITFHLFWHELGRLYAVEGAPAPVPALALQFADFAVWQ